MRATSILIILAASLFILPGLSAAPSPAELLTSGHVDEAVQFLEQQVRQTPNDAGSHNLLCRAYFMMEDWDRGISNCERARDLDPQNSLELFVAWPRLTARKPTVPVFFPRLDWPRKSGVRLSALSNSLPNNWEARADLRGILSGGSRHRRWRQGQSARPSERLDAAQARGKAYWLLGRIAEKEKDLADAERQYRAGIAATHSGARAWAGTRDLLSSHQPPRSKWRRLFANWKTHQLTIISRSMDGASLMVRTGRDPQLGVRLLRRYFSVGTVEEGPAFKAHMNTGVSCSKDRATTAAPRRNTTLLWLSSQLSPRPGRLKASRA